METILVVDDEHRYRAAVAEVVARVGCAPALAESTGEALAWLRAHPAPRLVLMDLFMPGADAVAFRREQVGDRAIREVPMALMVSTASLQRLSASVGMPILTKPVSDADLRALLAGGAAPAAERGRR